MKSGSERKSEAKDIQKIGSKRYSKNRKQKRYSKISKKRKQTKEKENVGPVRFELTTDGSLRMADSTAQSYTSAIQRSNGSSSLFPVGKSSDDTSLIIISAGAHRPTRLGHSPSFERRYKSTLNEP